MELSLLLLLVRLLQPERKVLRPPLQHLVPHPLPVSHPHRHEQLLLVLVGPLRRVVPPVCSCRACQQARHPGLQEQQPPQQQQHIL